MLEKIARNTLERAARNQGSAGSVMRTDVLASADPPKKPEQCKFCGGSGWRKISRGRDLQVARCECREMARGDYLVSNARIPTRYRDKNLLNFTVDGSQELLQGARLTARAFVEKYPVDCEGLLITGPSGTGKTHLAVGIIKELMLQKGIACLFLDYAELLSEIRNSYSASLGAGEAELLRPVYETDVLVLDDLGTSRSTEWVGEIVSLILNKRYSESRTTLITTNFLDGPSKGAEQKPTEGSEQSQKASQAMRQDTLGDRIGDRMLSRIHEMCRIIAIPPGTEDYRTKA